MNKINCLKNENIPVEFNTETIPPDADDNYDDCTGDNADTDAIEDVELNAGLTDDIVGDTLKENNLGKEVQPGLRNERKSIGGTGDHATTDQDDIRDEELHDGWSSVAGEVLVEIKNFPNGWSTDSGTREMIKNERQKNRKAYNYYITNLFGLSAWWARVCRPAKSLKPKKSNQDAKLSFLTNYSTSIVLRLKKINIHEKSANDGNVLGVTNNKKRLREDNTSMGENSRIFKKIYINLDPAESSKSGGPRPNCL